ncbi:MAG: ThiF family adenylyltransferase [Ardenticatenaceae bacterium]|nr:ThiF family adenylyltransferase [Anaerolineales bacterium]MCB9005848.1 ThiF family adenylyltransferase [Ardenticatenaceae bacterium]
MQTNTLDTISIDFTPTYRALLGETERMELYLVGTGGTGSALADALARILYHARQKGKDVSLTLIDPDTVEEKNIGRQRFCQAEVGWPKASALALRLNAAFGLDIRAIMEPFALDMIIQGYSSRTTKKLVIGCVDNYRPRQALAEVVARGNGHIWWLDVGNAYHNGNVYIGNHYYTNQLQVDETLRLCNGLPSPAVQDSALLLPDPPVVSPLSCADLTLREEQSLMINTMMAAIAANYCYQWVIQGEISSLSTAVTLNPPTMTSQQITREAMQAAFDRQQEEA